MEVSLLKIREVKKTYQVNFPNEVQDLVQYYHPYHAESVEWHFHESGLFAALSRIEDADHGNEHVIPDDEFIHTNRLGVNSGGSQITFESDVKSELEWEVDVGDEISYFAHQDMMEGERKTVFILHSDQIYRILEEGIELEPELAEYIRESLD